MATKPQTPQAAAKAPVIRGLPSQHGSEPNLLRLIPAGTVSVVMHLVMAGLFLFFSVIGGLFGHTPAPVQAEEVHETPVEDPADKADLTQPDIGINPEVPQAYDVSRIEPVNVPGPVDISQAVGVPGAPPDAPVANIPPPPGFGTSGLGGGFASTTPGSANPFGSPGGSGGLMVAGGFGGRSGSTRVRLAMTGGGNPKSEAAVAAGLLFLARHQSADGHWSLDKFQLECHQYEKGGANAARFNSNCNGQGMKNDIAGTAFGLLPFLGAGKTHKAPPPDTKEEINYQKVVEAALRYLMTHQTRDGEFPGGMYAHGLATIAICEAYGLTSDPALKPHAQAAIDFIVRAQDPAGGGWRYTPRSGGDTSVVGWQVMALKSGQMSGLSVPSSTLKGAEKWLDGCATSDQGGYGYTGPGETPTMSAVGLLCREYLGWSPKHKGLIAGMKRLEAVPPGSQGNMYYYYYATQVMHHMGGDHWDKWNPKMRDTLVDTQDMGTDAKRPWQRGSWDPKGDVHGGVGGRIMITSLSLLCLEVYYRHLPLYRRDLGVMKDMNDK